MISHYCIAVRGDNKALLWDVEDALVRLENSGEFEPLLATALPDVQTSTSNTPWRLISWGIGAVSITLAAAAVWVLTLRSELDRRTERLRREEARFKAITESVPAVVYGFLQKPDGSSELRYANRRLTEWTQWIPALTADADLRALASWIHPDHAESFVQRLDQSMRERVAFQQEVRVRDVKGSYRWVQITLDPLVVDEGVLWNGIIQDSTDLRVAHEALAQSERSFRQIFNSTHDAIVVSRLSDGRILEANEAACRMYGYGQSEMLQLHISALREEETPVPAASRESTMRTARHRVQDGSTIDVESSWAVVHYEGSPALLSVNRDVTTRSRFEEQRRQLETQLMQAQKMESLGLLAGGIAHDFNNLLVGIMGNASLARSHSTSADLQVPLDQIIMTTRHASDLTNQLLAYAGKSRLTIQEIDLSAMASETVRLLGSRLSQQAQVIFRTTDRPAITMADPVQIRQIIMNLLANASDAMREGSGFITLRTGVARFDRVYLSETFVPSDIAEGEYAFLEVADDGCGMSPDSMHRIFDPFYSTKFVGRGLGLSVALSIVQRHRGAIKVFSEQGRGTVFRLLLPIVNSRQISVAELKPAATARVLLIHSEPLVRDAIRRIMLHQGHSTSTAPSMEEARAMLGPAAGFGAIFIDEAQVGDDPARTALELRERSPGSSLIVVSDSLGASQSSETPFDLLIRKPFTTDSLLSALRSIAQGSGLT
jgi:PAS domain S-box-containing protein